MEVHIISPEGDVFQGTADAVFLPGTLGGFEVLDGHAPLVSTLGKGGCSSVGQPDFPTRGCGRTSLRRERVRSCPWKFPREWLRPPKDD